jgi:hypothetical protein
MTAHEALQHPFVAGEHRKEGEDRGNDLLPTVKKNFNARRTLHAAIDTVRAINKLREGQHHAGMMDGANSADPPQGAPALATAASNGSGAMSGSRDSGYGTADGGSNISGSNNVSAPINIPPRSDTRDADGDVKMKGVDRNSGQGQTTAQIEAQTRKIAETSKGLWQSRR